MQLVCRTGTPSTARQAPLRLPTPRSLPARGFSARTSNLHKLAHETRNCILETRDSTPPGPDHRVRGPRADFRALTPTHRLSRGLRPRGPTPHFAASAVNERSARESGWWQRQRSRFSRASGQYFFVGRSVRLADLRARVVMCVHMILHVHARNLALSHRAQCIRDAPVLYALAVASV